MAKEVKQKKCEQCGKLFKPYRITPVCSYVCAMAYNDDKESNKRLKRLKSNVKEEASLGMLIKLAKELAQKFARLRDKDLPCISCGSVNAQVYHGGHLWKSELYSGVKFHEYNINKQCQKCNTFLDGNEVNYAINFIERFGVDRFNFLTALAKETKNKKWSKMEVQEIINHYKQLINDKSKD
jgi:hypothetical protein